MEKINRSKLSVAFTHKSLCTRCGTCIGVCPTQALKIGESFYPEIISNKCIECGLCAKTCPGGSVSYKNLTQLTFEHNKDTKSFDGHVIKTVVGHAGDSHIRAGGAGGGVITALLWDLLKANKVKGCLVTRMNPDKPWFGEPFIARSYEELLQSQQSKYIVIPLNAMLNTIRKQEGPFAIAALPCQVHGYRLMENIYPELKQKISLIIGLYCASALEPNVALELLRARGISPNTVKNFHFRNGKWPGKIQAVLKNDKKISLHYSNFKDGAINYLTYLYSPVRCQTCIDGSAEFSDISVSDAWTRDSKGQYIFKGRSKLLVRTAKGQNILDHAIQSGTLVAEDITQNTYYQTHKLHMRKKGLTAPLRIARLARKGKIVPNVDRDLPDHSHIDTVQERLESSIMTLGVHHLTRYPLFKFLTSRYGIPLVKIRQFLKRRKYKNK